MNRAVLRPRFRQTFGFALALWSLSAILGVVVITFACSGIARGEDAGVYTGTVRRPLVVVNGVTEQMPSGDYLAANTLMDTSGCTSGYFLQWNGSAWVCAAGSSGISGSGSTNAITYWTSSSAVGTPGVNNQMTIGGPWIQSFNVPNTAYAYGEVNRIEIGGVVPAYPADLALLVLRDSATADTTTHTQRSIGIATEVTGARTAGANDLQNIGIECLASGGQVNNCLEALGGDIVADTGSIYTNGNGNIYTSNGFVAAIGGPIYAEGTGAQQLYFTSSGATDNIYSVDSSTRFNIHGGGASSLELFSDNQTFVAQIDGNLKFAAQASSGATHIIATGTGVSFTNASCTSTTCTDIAGTVTSSSTSMTITFANTYTGASDATCIIQGQGTATLPTCTESATAITCTTVINATKYNYICVGHQ